ncbi:peptide chain release factor 2 [Coprothermobacteraceae bacterium]|nr:peptide chain release factor 2 [Coprothermobacteraceae bacterium]
MTLLELTQRAQELRATFDELRSKVRVDALKKQLSEARSQYEDPSIWSDQERAVTLARLVQQLEDEIAKVEGIEGALSDLEAAIELLHEAHDEEMFSHATQLAADLEQRIEQFRLLTLFNEPYDKNDAILTLHAGAGGVDAMDWTQMLMRMYLRWAERQGYSVEVVDVSRGEEAGVKSCTIVVKGLYAYGYLRAEKGVHRLVRLSPFDADHRRHTSFALVDVVPDIEDVRIEINPEDLEMETFRSGGAGGQHQNKTESGVRITHKPTGITVTVTEERSQVQNRDRAMKILKARLHQYYEEERKRSIEEIRGNVRSASWGNQIRSYVFHPYNLVKDHRTGYSRGDVDAVMDGDITDFMVKYLKGEKSTDGEDDA